MLKFGDSREDVGELVGTIIRKKNSCFNKVNVKEEKFKDIEECYMLETFMIEMEEGYFWIDS